MNKNLNLTILPEWENIELIHGKITTFLEEYKFDANVVYSIGMIASELLENAIKFGTFDSNPNITISMDVNKEYITIEVVNGIGQSSSDHLKELDKIVQWIRGFQDPFEAYINTLRTVSSKKLKKGESGLGLARIAYEGNAIVDFYTNNSLLFVSALYTLTALTTPASLSSSQDML